MRPVSSFGDIAIVYGVAPGVGWKESTVVRCVLIVYAHSPVPIVLAGKISGGPAAGSGMWLGVGDHLMPWAIFGARKKMQNHEK